VYIVEDSIKMTGRILVEHYRDDVLLNEPKWINNVVTTVGKNSLATLLSTTNGANTFVTNMGFGTVSGNVSATDTALLGELTIGTNGYARPSITSSNPSSGVVQYLSTLTGMTASTTVQEVGLFNQATAGTLIAHQLTGQQYTLASIGDKLQVTWQLSVG
jgi:hypothetical protein